MFPSNSRVHALVGLSRENADSRDQTNPVNHQRSPAKRKRPSSVKIDERKKVSRACDACKEKKLRCTGTQPCPRCIHQSLQCHYNKAHRRGRPSPPEPRIPATGHEQTAEVSSAPNQQPQETLLTATNQNDLLEPLDLSQDPRKSSRSSQDADGTRFEGDYIGPTSGIAFLHRAQKRFQQDYAVIKSRNSEHQGSKKVSVYSFGDGWVPDYSDLEYTLPSRADANHLLDRYFDFAMPTYRFVHRPTIELWLQRMYDVGNTQVEVFSNAKKAIVVLIMATAKLYNENATDLLPDGQIKQSEESGMFFAEAERLLNSETGPVRVESVQARLAQCIHLLASSRINQAWYIFGTATQMITALGLHRKPHTNSVAPTSRDDNIDCRKRVFWSAYTLDRYLSVILGRPRVFRDEDIDQSLPETLNDLRWNSSLAETRPNQSVSEGPIYHAKLARILGTISSDLYPTSRTIDTEWTKSAERLTSELKQWKKSLPAFLDPTKVDPSMLIPIFQRQSTVLGLAYAHALILANRPALLSSFADLSRRQGIPLGEPVGSLKECIDAALVVVVSVNGLIGDGQMRKAFWFTHYVSFCAISALYVYTIQQCLTHQNSGLSGQRSSLPDTRHFEAAKKCQKQIEDTTTMTSPFRRYNIILDELKKEVLHRLRLRTHYLDQEQVRNDVGTQPSATRHDQQSRRVMDSSGGTPSTTPTNTDFQAPPFNVTSDESLQQGQSHQFHPQINVNNPMDMQPVFEPEPSALVDFTMMDLGVFGLQGDLMGWSEFDSCAINWPEGLDVFDSGL